MAVTRLLRLEGEIDKFKLKLEEMKYEMVSNMNKLNVEVKGVKEEMKQHEQIRSDRGSEGRHSIH